MNCLAQCIENIAAFRASDDAPMARLGFNLNLSLFKRGEKDDPCFNLNTDGKRFEVCLVDLALVVAGIIALSVVVCAIAKLWFNLRYHKRF